jgi:hypothetical protein
MLLLILISFVVVLKIKKIWFYTQMKMVCLKILL